MVARSPGLYLHRRQRSVAYPLGVTEIPNHAVWPYMQQWNLSIERQLMKNTVVQVGYVGSKGTHLALQLDANQLQPILLQKIRIARATDSHTVK